MDEDRLEGREEGRKEDLLFCLSLSLSFYHQSPTSFLPFFSSLLFSPLYPRPHLWSHVNVNSRVNNTRIGELSNLGRVGPKNQPKTYLGFFAHTKTGRVGPSLLFDLIF